MKKIAYLGLFMFLGIILAACSNTEEAQSSGNDEEEYVLKVSYAYGTGTHHHDFMEWFDEELQQRSDGRLSLELFPNAQLMPPDQELSAILEGQIDMTHILTSAAATFDDSWYLFDLPFLFDYDTEDPSVYIDKRREFLDHENGGQKLSEIMEEKGLKVLAHSSTNTFGSPYTTSESTLITNPESASGLRMRTSGGNIVPETLNQANMEGISVEGSEVAPAIQQGLVDGLVTTLEYAYSNNFDVETTTYLPLANYITPVIMSQSKFESMPEDLQNILVETGKDFETYADEKVAEFDSTVHEKFENEYGYTVHLPTEDEIEQWEETLLPVRETYIETVGEQGEEFLELVDEINGD